MDLSLVLLDDLMDELKKRYDVFIFAYVNRLDNKEEDVMLQYHGGRMACVGLSEMMKSKLMHELSDEMEEGWEAENG